MKTTPPPSCPPGLHTEQSPSCIGIPDLQRAGCRAPLKASKDSPVQVRGFQDSPVFMLTWELAITLHEIFFIFDEIILSCNFSYFLTHSHTDDRDSDHDLKVKKKKRLKNLLIRGCSFRDVSACLKSTQPAPARHGDHPPKSTQICGHHLSHPRQQGGRFWRRLSTAGLRICSSECNTNHLNSAELGF